MGESKSFQSVEKSLISSLWTVYIDVKMSCSRVHVEDKLFFALRIHVGMGMYIPLSCTHWYLFYVRLHLL